MTNKLTSRIRILAVVGLVAVNMFFAAASFADTSDYLQTEEGWISKFKHFFPPEFPSRFNPAEIM